LLSGRADKEEEKGANEGRMSRGKGTHGVFKETSAGLHRECSMMMTKEEKKGRWGSEDLL